MPVADKANVRSIAASAKRPPVLLVTQVFPPVVGGSGQLLESVYSRMTDVDVTVMVDDAISGGTDTQRGILKLHRTKINDHWGILTPSAMRQHLRLARLIARTAADHAPIVHCGRALPEATPALLSRAFTRKRIKYLFWSHGEDVTTAWTSRDYTLAMSLTYRHAAAAIANSRNTARMVERAGLPPEKIHVVYPGVDTDRFRPDLNARGVRQRYVGDESVLLLSVGRLVKRKGHHVSLRALARLRDSRVCYVIVGNGPERENLEALTRELGLQKQVFFAGEVDPTELPLYFAACDIFLLPNSEEGVGGHDFEGFGLVFLEAAACGKPTVGGRSGGVPEAIEENETGLLVTQGSVEELEAHLRHLVQSESRRQAMGTAGRQRVLRSFTWERAAARVTEIHDEVAGQP
jgi:phosphatidylinositol alpha-1,6-mannosyltransferase